MDEDRTLDMNTLPSTPRDVPAARDAWGRFKLLARVGQGGFGEVYRAWDPDLEREVALKLLLPSPTGNGQTDEEYKAMLREARALASVRHPNIVPVYGIDRHDGRVGFWTDFVKGKTLSALLGSQGAFGYREAVLIGLDVTRALSAVHRSGLLHRDIKAENVMREEGGHILLMDFGLSTLPHRQEDIAGTPNYMAPELWQGKTATVASDIYSMGVLLFYLVTGEYPARLGGLSRAEATAALAQKRTLMDLRSDLPDQFLRAVGRAIETDPAKRFSSAGQLSEALAECIGTAVPVEAVALTPLPVEPPRNTRPWQLRVAVAALVLGAAAFKTPMVRGWLHLDEASKHAVVAGAPADIDAEYSEAKGLLSKSYKDSNLTEAITKFQDILKKNPDFALAQAGLGAAYFKQYKNDSSQGSLLDSAKSATDEALRLDPASAPALVTRAQIEAVGGKTDLAVRDANQALKLDPRSADAYAALGEVYQSQGRGKDAIEQIKQAIDIAPENSMWPLRLGHYYMLAGDLQDAAAQWKNSVRIDPQNTFALYDLGLVNMRLNKLDDAREDFQKVLSLQPDAYSYRALGTVFQLQGNYTSAAEMDEKAIELDPSDYQAWGSLGSVYIWSGDKHEQAEAAYRKAIELAEGQRRKTPEDAEVLADLASLYASIGNVESSLLLARKALGLSPDDPNISYSVAYSYEVAGQRSKAIALFAKAVARGTRGNEFQRSPELARLRSDPTFQVALDKAKAELAVDSKTKLN
ncbi:serine/threonine-protein kinase [Granulicella aggregans]|uniref:Serine/threonine-protein kinase n=1 Tax=Granulicella aggregans TaxID=474949 RepID=A0A7W7ZF67_9BACT|nr:serine/threonine-protein kinase [Granulicella aggregans]MBB5058672.1 serine/threonine-protein kinase [Granulicella aggregans]